jgi:hypothetical protein
MKIQINKPFLPIAAKSMSESTAWFIVLFCLTAGKVSLLYTNWNWFLIYFLNRNNDSKNNIFACYLPTLYGRSDVRDYLLSTSYSIKTISFICRKYYCRCSRIFIEFWCVLCCSRSSFNTISMESCGGFYC